MIVRSIKNNPKLKWLLGIIGVIILGAIGSGVWQIVGDPIFNFIVNITIDGMNIFIKNYKDELYSGASLGLHEQASDNTFSLLMLLLPASIFLYSFRSWLNISKSNMEEELAKIDSTSSYAKDKLIVKLASEKNLLEKKIRMTLKALFLLTIMLLIIGINTVVEISFKNRIIIYVEATLDRLSPYLDKNIVVQYRAEFREVDKAEKYYVLYGKLERELKKHNLPSRSVSPL